MPIHLLRSWSFCSWCAQTCQPCTTFGTARSHASSNGSSLVKRFSPWRIWRIWRHVQNADHIFSWAKQARQRVGSNVVNRHIYMLGFIHCYDYLKNYCCCVTVYLQPLSLIPRRGPRKSSDGAYSTVIHWSLSILATWPCWVMLHILYCHTAVREQPRRPGQNFVFFVQNANVKIILLSKPLLIAWHEDVD